MSPPAPSRARARLRAASWRGLLLVCCAGLFGGCSDDRTGAGPGFESTAQAAGQPAMRAVAAAVVTTGGPSERTRDAGADAAEDAATDAGADASVEDAGEEDAGEGVDTEEPDEADDAIIVLDEEVERRAAEAGVTTPSADYFFDVRDRPIRARLSTLDVQKIKRGRGGRSLGFKMTLVDGTKGYFKAEQTFSAANWNSEIAAYHLDRMLGFHRVPPVVSRAFPWKRLRSAARGDKRRKEIIKRRDGTVRGAFIWWIPGGLRTWPHLPGWEKWIRVRGWPSTTITPYQRPAVWAHRLKLRRELGDEWLTPDQRRRRRHFDSRPDRDGRAAELSDMIVFDYLTKNVDRWGGRNANVLIRGRGGPLVFLDNGAGFAPGRARPSLMETRLHVLQRFRKSTIRAIRAFEVADFKKRLDKEPLAPILYTREFRHLQERREALLKWVARMERRYGERAFPWE